MLYHISFQRVPDNKFLPRIPASRSKGEDATIPRICFAKSIENAITASPQGGLALKTLLAMSKSIDIAPILHVYSIDEEYVSDSLMDSKEINQYVSDSMGTTEHWITKEVMCYHSIIKVQDAIITKHTDKHNNEIWRVAVLEWNSIDIEPDNSFENIINRHGEIDLQKTGVRKILANMQYGKNYRWKFK